MDDLLTFLPPEWAAWLRVIAEVSFALSLLAAAVKPLLGDPSPQDPRWKKAIFSLMHAVDLVAANTETVRAKKQRVKDEQVAQVLRKIRNTPPLMMLAVMLVSSGCAGSQLRTHASIADAAEGPILAAKHFIEVRAHDEAAAIRSRGMSADSERQEMAALQASYAPVESALTALIAAYNSYIDAIRVSHATGQEISHAVAMALLSRWQTFLDAARALGIQLPDPPDVLRELGDAS